MCNHCSPRVYASKGVLHAQARRNDPTNTGTIRRKFEKDIDRRFNQLKRLIRESLVDNDGLGLNVNAQAAGERAFAFSRNSQKVTAFMEWLRQAQGDLILETRRGTRLGVVGDSSWADLYIESAYQRGLANAANNLRGAGVEVSDRWLDSAFYRPIHADSAGLIFTRTYSGLRGVTEAMDAQISRVLSQGLIEGLSSDRIARNIADRVDKIGRTRARVIARTETVAAVSEATLNTYEEAGLEGVNLQAEFLTARDEAVCPVCQALSEGGPYTISEARGLIPAHPNCRCAWLPAVGDPQSVALR